MTRFIVCGEALIDLVQARPRDETFSSSWNALSAGGPMNSAVALSKLGRDAHFLGRISRDVFGEQLRDHMTAAGLELDLATEASQATSIAVVSLDERGVASYTFHFAETANFGWQLDDLPTLGEGDWLHIASLACVVRPGSDILLDWAANLEHVGISYDINVRPTVITEPAEYWERVKPWLRVLGRRQGVLKASDEDLEYLAKAVSPAGDVVDMVASWVEDYGLGLAVITLGPDGSVAVDSSGRRTHAEGFPTEVVDTVGAGDTFMAGFLDAYVQQQGIEAALTRGAAAASIVCSRRGPQPPTAEETDELIASRGRQPALT